MLSSEDGRGGDRSQVHVKKSKTMNSIYFWMLFLALRTGSMVHSYSGNIPESSNEVNYWEKPQQKPVVAKYEDGKYPDSVQNNSRRLIGRHVCMQSKVVMVPIKDMQSYCKPVYQSYLRRCDREGTSGFCTGYRVVYELAYRTVQTLVPKTQSVYSCCPGWTQSLISAMDCKKAICREPCRNGGFCSKPDQCTCPPNWTGKACETDVDECLFRRYSCEQDCVNVPGSFRCSCREGFTLQTDRRSCKKDEVKRSSGNDIELLKTIEHLQQRLTALETWQRRLSTDGPDSRHQRDDRINSLSEQMHILEETLDKYRRKLHTIKLAGSGTAISRHQAYRHRCCSK